VGFAVLFDSGFLGLKTPAPTSTPTSCPNTVAPVAKLKQSAAETKSAARRIALVLIILSLVLFGIAIIVEKFNLWITEELLDWIVDQLCPGS
jgi:hypothetical protein